MGAKISRPKDVSPKDALTYASILQEEEKIIAKQWLIRATQEKSDYALIAYKELANYTSDTMSILHLKFKALKLMSEWKPSHYYKWVSSEYIHPLKDYEKLTLRQDGELVPRSVEYFQRNLVPFIIDHMDEIFTYWIEHYDIEESKKMCTMEIPANDLDIKHDCKKEGYVMEYIPLSEKCKKCKYYDACVICNDCKFSSCFYCVELDMPHKMCRLYNYASKYLEKTDVKNMDYYSRRIKAIFLDDMTVKRLSLCDMTASSTYRLLMTIFPNIDTDNVALKIFPDYKPEEAIKFPSTFMPAENSILYEIDDIDRCNKRRTC